jgi:hypothetical protein
VVENGLLHLEHLLQHQLLNDGHFGIALGDLLDLLGLGHQLLVHQVDLLDRELALVHGRSLAWRRRLSPDVVQRLFVVRLELGVFEFPRLSGSATAGKDSSGWRTDIWSVGRCPALFIVLAHFVKVIFVQLADEAGKVAVFEMFGKDGFGEFLVLDEGSQHGGADYG